ncbi:MAG: CD3324 family protein [Spirochaetaceae bacterium]|jgi:Mor family transcriptional regulator|nr:CD3324 family protein [Spirochaetaceae bacterium]
MSYVRAEEYLPPELIKEIQKYIQGSQIYIPGDNDKRLSWGEKNGTKEKLRLRNAEIKRLKSEGWTIDSLADKYYLSTDSIRKILYKKREFRKSA